MQVDNIFIDPSEGTCKVGHKKFPVVGFGTYQLQGEEGVSAIRTAWNLGYRIFDTATLYKNFDAVKEGLRSRNRSDYYLISKAWHDKHAPDDLNKDLDKTLDNLEIDCLDAYLLHWPNSQISINKTLGAMNDLREEGKIRHIGLSNVTVNHLKRALECDVPISWVQVEMHPNFCDFELLKFCSQNGIVVQAWRPLDLGNVGIDEMLIEIGKNYGKSPFHVALRWIIQNKCLPLPRSKSHSHIKDNFDVFDFSLSDREMIELNERAKGGQRFRVTEQRGMGFTDEFDYSYEECWPN